jgi:hypothetical protein
VNGGSGDDDGRLDLDELGEVVDTTTTVDPDAPTELLDDGRGRSWGERLEDAGVTPWLRRHQVAVVATTAACVIVGAGAAAYVRGVPPPLDPALRVTVTELVPERLMIGDDSIMSVTTGVTGIGGRARAAYGITPDDPGDTSTYTLIGIDGPVVRASSTNAHAGAGTAAPVAGDVDVILDCTDSSALDPEPGGYSLRVARTDAWGRTLVASVQVPDGPTGWPAYVAANCAHTETVDGIQLRGVAVRDTGRPGAVTVELDVVNTLPVEVRAATLPSGGFPVVSTRLAPTPIAARASARLPLDLVVHDCAAPTLYPISATDPDDPEPAFQRTAPGAYLDLDLATRATAADRAIPAPTGTAEVHWSETTAREIDDALRRSCSGGPTRPPVVGVVGSSIRVTGVRLAPGGATGTDRDVSMLLDVDTTGTRVAVGAPEQAADVYTGSFLAPAAAPVRDGRATVSTTWSFDCSGGAYSPPPTIAVVVTTARGAYPFQTQLNSAELSRTVLSICENAGEQQLVGSGWVPPTPSRRLPLTGA